MSVPGVTVVLDPEDDAIVTRLALAAHRPSAGVVTIHPTPGRLGTEHLAWDVLVALGKRASRVTDTSGIKVEEAAWRAGAAWAIAYGVRTIVVLRAHLLRRAHWERLMGFQDLTGATLLLFCHTRKVPSEMDTLLAGVDHTIMEDLTHAVKLLQPVSAGDAVNRGEMAPPPVGVSFPIVPRSTLSRFRADAWRRLAEPEFAEVDRQYRYGREAACVWLTRQEEYTAATPEVPVSAAELVPQLLGGESAHAQAQIPETVGPIPGRQGFMTSMCVGPERPRYPGYPFAWRDRPGLQVFLSALVTECPSPEASVARVRGAQAGFLLHGMMLAVPRDLRTEKGPGLTSTALTSAVCERLREHLPNPVHAAALAITLATGVSLAQIGHLKIASIGARAEFVRANGSYAIPPAARPLIIAARAFRLLGGARDDGRLLVGPRGAHGVAPRTLEDDARACGVTAPVQGPYSDEPTLVPPSAWHVRAQCWFVADPLHGLRQPDPDLGRLP